MEDHACSLNEKLCILKIELDEKANIGMKNEERLKNELRDLGEELISLKKKRNAIFIEDMEEKSLNRRNSIRESRIIRLKQSRESSMNTNRVSIQVMEVSDENKELIKAKSGEIQSIDDSRQTAAKSKIY